MVRDERRAETGRGSAQPRPEQRAAGDHGEPRGPQAPRRARPRDRRGRACRDEERRGARRPARRHQPPAPPGTTQPGRQSPPPRAPAPRRAPSPRRDPPPDQPPAAPPDQLLPPP